MAFLKSLWSILQQWAVYVSYCVEQPIPAPICRPFWTWVIIASFVIGGLLTIAIAWKIASHRRKLAAALRAEQQRARVDHDAIAARKWYGDDVPTGELSSEDVDQRIREAVEQRRAGSSERRES